MTTTRPWCEIGTRVQNSATRPGHPEEEMPAYKETLRRLALNDEAFVDSVLGMGRDTVEVSRLDQKTHALVRLAASLAVDAAPSSYQSNVEAALAAGASLEEVVGTLIAVAPTVGLARVVSAAPELALALGYDVDAALESHDEEVE
jgi:alkylhydroperoxidase/carboxymuconolactone decarboxylase family protein YurZ